ncbi:hypothetical protein ACOBR2_11350 [Telmatobacter bradus]|jgi:hypothetical protein|uniref:hypothetical protein n=1 Tax=Telmatobacter bradus TaxID=474953 RepID=UPI003B43CBE5
MFKQTLFMLSLILVASSSVPVVFAQTNSEVAPVDVRTEDSVLLDIPGAVLDNNVYGKGNITNYKQSIFRGKNNAGWNWDWPESGGPELKSYPEVLIGRSPWSDVGGIAGAAELHAGNQLPRRLSEARQTLDFDFVTVANGLWLASFDFWITSSDHPAKNDIVSNLCIWTMNHGLKPSDVYKGRHMKLKIGGRTYEAIFETPKDNPDKSWKTLCLIDTEPRSKGSLALGPLMDALIAHGLAKPTDFLATAELGTEVAFGKGHTTLQIFKLR